MARSPTTTDAFNAVAEPARRRIVALLAKGELSVNDIVGALRMKQPQVSKHLRVLREVGLVTVRGDGQQRIYALNAVALKPIHDWVQPYERLWNERMDRLEAVLREMQAEGDG